MVLRKTIILLTHKYFKVHLNEIRYTTKAF